MNKNELRESILNIRRRFGGEKESLEICENILNMKEYREAECVAAFVPYKSEVNITPLISTALREKKVCFPVTGKDDTLEFYFAETLSKLRPGKYGVLCPPETHIAEHIDFMLVPGIVFDRKGFRIGYGKGCYDRYLSGKNIFTCAVGYSFQLKEKIEHEEHDIAVRAFIDEKEILYF